MLKILVLYYNPVKCNRQTLIDHLYSFQSYGSGASFDYYNVLWHLPSYFNKIQYDAIILHYSLLSVRWDQDYWKKRYCKTLKKLKYFSGLKIAIPQDEYAHTNVLCDLFREIGVSSVYTCALPSEYEKLYPQRKTGKINIFTTYPGYVDEQSISKINALSQLQTQRSIDIGYRARNLPFWLGSHGQLKKRLADFFLDYDTKDLKIDISTSENDVFRGDDWFRFLLRCRTVLGCLGGASLHDPDGSIRKAVDQYVFLHPDATFQDVEQKFFKGKDGNLKLFALSPRHFECAMTKTCQVLVEGDYHGIFEAGNHYIELKKDFSNIDDVLCQIGDSQHCKRIAERAYQDLVVSGKYTYRAFVNDVIKHIKEHSHSVQREHIRIVKRVSFNKKLESFRISIFNFAYNLFFSVPRKAKKAFLLLKRNNI